MKRPGKKYLGIQDWLEVFREGNEQARILSGQALRRASGLSPVACRQAIHRLKRKGLLLRVGPDLYATAAHPPSLEEVAMVVGRPAYVSLETVLSRYSILPQIPQVLTCITTQKPRILRTPLGEIRFRSIQKNLFFGFKNEEGILSAEPEKAFLDWLYLGARRKAGKPTMDEMDLSLLNRKKVWRMAAQFPPTTRKELAQIMPRMAKKDIYAKLLDLKGKFDLRIDLKKFRKDRDK